MSGAPPFSLLFSWAVMSEVNAVPKQLNFFYIANIQVLWALMFCTNCMSVQHHRIVLNITSPKWYDYMCPEQNSNLGPSRIAVFEDCKATALNTQPPRLDYRIRVIWIKIKYLHFSNFNWLNFFLDCWCCYWSDVPTSWCSSEGHIHQPCSRKFLIEIC